MFHSKCSPIDVAAFLLWVACCISSSARAGDFDWSGGGVFDASRGQGTPELLSTLERRLPLEPHLPLRAVVCATLSAELTSSAFASPSTTDPDVDSIAAVTARSEEHTSELQSP